jgi:hypothetical protein
MANANAELYGAAPGETTTAIMFTLENGRIVRMRDCRSGAEALHAIGAS